MSTFFDAMSGAQLMGFGIFVVMTVAFFAWVAWLTLTK